MLKSFVQPGIILRVQMLYYVIIILAILLSTIKSRLTVSLLHMQKANIGKGSGQGNDIWPYHTYYNIIASKGRKYSSYCLPIAMETRACGGYTSRVR